MISINDVSISFSGKDLFKNVSFQINTRDKIGLVGKNGSGKSTLLKMIIREISYDSGIIAVPNDVQIGYLPQQIDYKDGKTVFEEAFSAFAEFKELQKQSDKLTEEFANRTDYESNEYHDLLEKISDMELKLSFQNQNIFEAETEMVLKGLGFEQKDFQRKTNEFSGGWRMRIEIAKILLRKPDVLLLDEPTNHLDIESIQWLENFLVEHRGALVLISHDRRFLDNVTKRTLEISLGKIYDYNVAYTQYKELSQERRDQQIASYENQQSKLKQTERFIERFRSKATKATQVQSRIKMMDKIEKIEIEPEDKTTINFRFPPAPRSGDIVVETKEITKKYGDHIVFKDVDLILERGEKIAFVGKNGEGKTTMARIIAKELDYDGVLKIGHNVNIGYYAQNQDEILDKSLTVFETLDNIAVGDIRSQLRRILGAFLFRDDDVDKKVAVLSGGERARLALAKLILQPYSLLILDEPTNHLDMPAKDILKNALLKYDGSLILVSHDRDFLDGLVNTVYEYNNQKTRQFKGDINYFLEKKKIEHFDQLSIQNKNTQKNVYKESVTKDDFNQKKEKKRVLSKIQRQIEQTEKDIESLEAEIKKSEHTLANPNGVQQDNFFGSYEKLKKDLAAKFKLWEELQIQLEQCEM